MAVYVDSAPVRLGWIIVCHMAAVAISNLLQMAYAIKLHQPHFQPCSHKHFDVSLGFRERSIALNAAEVDRRAILRVIQGQRTRLAEVTADLAAYEAVRKYDDTN